MHGFPRTQAININKNNLKSNKMIYRSQITSKNVEKILLEVMLNKF